MSYTKKAPSNPNEIQKRILEEKGKRGQITEDHVIKRMYERGIMLGEVEAVLQYGVVREEQEHEDSPKIRYQIVGLPQNPIGVVVGFSKNGRLVKITVLKMRG